GLSSYARIARRAFADIGAPDFLQTARQHEMLHRVIREPARIRPLAIERGPGLDFLAGGQHVDALSGQWRLVRPSENRIRPIAHRIGYTAVAAGQSRREQYQQKNRASLHSRRPPDGVMAMLPAPPPFPRRGCACLAAPRDRRRDAGTRY